MLCKPSYSCSFLCGDGNQFFSFFLEPLLTHYSPCSSHLINRLTDCSQLPGEKKGAAHVFTQGHHQHTLAWLLPTTACWKGKTSYEWTIQTFVLIRQFSFLHAFRKWLLCFTNMTNNKNTNHLQGTPLLPKCFQSSTSVYPLYLCGKKA